MSEIKVDGMTVERAAKAIVEKAPAWCYFNGTRMDAKVGDTVATILGRFVKDRGLPHCAISGDAKPEGSLCGYSGSIDANGKRASKITFGWCQAVNGVWGCPKCLTEFDKSTGRGIEWLTLKPVSLPEPAWWDVKGEDPWHVHPIRFFTTLIPELIAGEAKAKIDALTKAWIQANSDGAEMASRRSEVVDKLVVVEEKLEETQASLSLSEKEIVKLRAEVCELKRRPPVEADRGDVFGRSAPEEETTETIKRLAQKMAENLVRANRFEKEVTDLRDDLVESEEDLDVAEAQIDVLTEERDSAIHKAKRIEENGRGDRDHARKIAEDSFVALSSYVKHWAERLSSESSVNADEVMNVGDSLRGFSFGDGVEWVGPGLSVEGDDES